MLKSLSLGIVFFVSVFSVWGQSSATVIATKANLRGTPSARGKIVTTVKKDDTVDVISKRGAWYLVQTIDSVGWINGNSISIDSAVSDSTAPNPTFDRWGDPNGRFMSDGGGQGSGRGTGSGTGQGSGRGVGSGSGIGTGSGSGTSMNAVSGSENTGSITQELRIISKPPGKYTDAARENNIQGIVVLRITFLASGQIGSISVVKGLPHGLTEQAIAAARLISFEPKKVDGVPQTVTRTMEYPFTIY